MRLRWKSEKNIPARAAQSLQQIGIAQRVCRMEAKQVGRTGELYDGHKLP